MTNDLSIIAAVSINGVIGRDDLLPWRLPSDLRQFREITLGHAIIMGRKTFESVKSFPFDKRFNIVVTRSGKLGYFGAIVKKAMDLSHAIDTARNFTRRSENQRIFIIGGGEIFKEAIDLVDHMRITRVLKEYEGDTVFPEINLDSWDITQTCGPYKSPLDCCRYEVVQYERRK